MGKSSRPLRWLVDFAYLAHMKDLEAQGHTVDVYEDCDGLFRADHDIILSTKAWYCPNVEFLTKYRDIIVKQARLRKYGKDGKE